ncbi:VOC family protein [Massilia sp. TWP1-3-3]|uniref:VOC family protein n=1 Tax=Massilia sp. TWP1-3-3 TaxID=2804573 RepID=UPI003CF5167B
MNAQVRAIPEDMHTLTPHLVCADALGAIDFYKRAFGATEGGVMLTPDGKLMHGMIRIGDSALMLMEENQQWGALGPTMLGGSPVTIHLYVKNCDEVYAKAVAEGATAKMVPADMFWGDRYGVLTDPFGHSWSVATHIRDVPHDEMQAAMASMGDCPDAVPQA